MPRTGAPARFRLSIVAALIVARGELFLVALPAEHTSFVDRVERIDDHLRARERYSHGLGALAKARQQRGLAFARQTCGGYPRGEFGNTALVGSHARQQRRRGNPNSVQGFSLLHVLREAEIRTYTIL